MDTSNDRSPRFDLVNIVLGIIVVPLYLFVWPFISFSMLFSFWTGSQNFQFGSTGKILATVPDNWISYTTVFLYTLFFISLLYIWISSKNNYLRVISVSFSFSFMVSPGAIGGEGFGLPAPFPITVFPPGFAVANVLRDLYVITAVS